MVMITVGMELRLAQFKTLLATPRLPLLGTLVHTFSFPALAVALILLIRAGDIAIGEATVIGILLIAACPSGGFSNVLVLLARANLPLSITLTFISTVLSFATVPLLMMGFGFLLTDLAQPISLPVGATLLQLVVLILLPTGLGMWLRVIKPNFTAHYLKRLQNAGQVALYICVAMLIAENFETVIAGIGDALPWSILLCVLNIGLCYQLSKMFGLVVEDRITVALEGSVRNLAVALLIAVNVGQPSAIAVLPTVYFLAVLGVAIVFAKTWRRFLSQPLVVG